MDGEIIKYIRKSKGLTQQQVLHNAELTQSAFSKFEKNRMELRASALLEILGNLDISPKEYSFIRNGYRETKKEQIMNEFFQAPYHKQGELQRIAAMCEDYLAYEKSQIIMDILYLCKGLPAILEKNDFSEAFLQTMHIWKRLEKNDELYWYDLLLINAIFFIFPFEVRETIYAFFKRTLQKYKHYRDVEILKINALLNMSILYIEERHLVKALKEIEEAIELCKKEQKYVQLSIAYSRKGICLKLLKEDGEFWIQKAKQILIAVEDLQTLEKLEAEVGYFEE